jgi:polyisoprenoid-binding protein YceI
MKNGIILVGATLSLLITSCGGEKGTGNASSNATESATLTKLTIDTMASTLKWKGSKSEEDFHVGSLKFKSGSLSAQGASNVSGEFILNMGSLVVEDKELPSDKKEMLKRHLAAKDYFDVSKFPEVSVKVNGYKEGKLATTISLLGKEMKQDIPVTLTNNGSKTTIIGTFDLDLKSLNIEGLKVNEEKPDETIKSIVSFDLNIVLNNK